MGTIRKFLKKNGLVSYHAEIRLRGYPTERDTFRTYTAAKDWVRDTESALKDGRHAKTTEAKRHTVGELIDRFIAQWLPKNPKSQAKQTALLTWWKNRLGHLLLADLTPGVIAEARDALLCESTNRKSLRSPSTANRYLAALSKFLSILVREWGLLDDNIMRKITKPSENPGRERFLSIEEKDRLLRACKDSSDPFLYPLVSLSIQLALRYSELVTLCYENLDFNMHTITLSKTKNGDRRVIPMTEAAESLFKLSPTYSSNPVGLIFRSPNKNKPVSVRTSFRKALIVSGISGFRWHDLRHTGASYLAMQGATQGELMAILGHRSPNMTRRYAHYSQDHIRKLLEKANMHLDTSQYSDSLKEKKQ